MFETPLTVVGRIVTDPTLRRVGDQEVVRFRMASNSRRRTPEGNWEPGTSLYLTVNCWGRLATGVAGNLTKGDPVVVAGVVHTSEYEDREGVRRSSLEMRAGAVGPDLSRCTARIGRLRTATSDADGAGDGLPHDSGADSDVDVADGPDTEEAGVDEADADDGGLPMSA